MKTNHTINKFPNGYCKKFYHKGYTIRYICNTENGFEHNGLVITDQFNNGILLEPDRWMYKIDNNKISGISDRAMESNEIYQNLSKIINTNNIQLLTPATLMQLVNNIRNKCVFAYNNMIGGTADDIMRVMNNDIATENMYNIAKKQPSPIIKSKSNQFKTLLLGNGYKINIKMLPNYAGQNTGLPQSFMITDANGNGKCFYSDGYVNPVKNWKTDPSKGVKSNGFSRLQGIFNDQNIDALYQCVESLMRNNKIIQKSNSTSLGKKHHYTISARKTQQGQITSLMITDENGNGKCFYSDGYVNPVKNRHTIPSQGYKHPAGNQLFLQLASQIKYNQIQNIEAILANEFNIQIPSKQPSLFKSNQSSSSVNQGPAPTAVQKTYKITLTQDGKYQTIHFHDGLKVSSRVKTVFGQNESIMITDANGNGKCFYSDGYVNNVINGKTIPSQYERKETQYFTQLKFLLQNRQYNSLNNLCHSLLGKSINSQVSAINLNQKKGYSMYFK